MADVSSGTPSPLDDLKAFRKMLVEERRKIVRAALEAHDTAPADHVAPTKLKIIQEQIEAVDRAIADEGQRQPSIFDNPAYER
jgi:hypothetical protein